jgi:hypothetical protein
MIAGLKMSSLCSQAGIRGATRTRALARRTMSLIGAPSGHFGDLVVNYLGKRARPTGPLMRRVFVANDLGEIARLDEPSECDLPGCFLGATLQEL